MSPAPTLLPYGSPRSASGVRKWRVFVAFLFVAVLLILARGSMRQPVHAEAGAPPTPAGVVEQYALRDQAVAQAEALASRAIRVLESVASSSPAPTSVAPVSPSITDPPSAAVTTPRPAVVAPATTLTSPAADTWTLAADTLVTSSVPPVTTPLSELVTSLGRLMAPTNAPVTPIEPSQVVLTPDTRVPVAVVPATEAALLIPVLPSASSADRAPLTNGLASPSGSPDQTKPAALTAPLAAAAPNPPGTVSQCNGTDNVGGEAVACEVTITNELNMATGETSSVVEVEECHGAANTVLTCVHSVTPSDELTTSVDQCNGSGSGGGGTVECNVHIVNNITGPATTTPATINQCNGSGAGGGTLPTVMCDPIGNTTDATITQCNDSGNGGGGTMRVQCTVTPSTETSFLPVDVNQCNGSGNGGGATVTCTVSVTNNIIPEPPVVVPPPVIEPPVVTPPVVTPPVVVPPPVIEPPVVAPPVVAPPVAQPAPEPLLPVEATTPSVITTTPVTLATPVSTMTVTQRLTTAFTLPRQTVTPSPQGPQPAELAVATVASVTSTPVGSVSVPVASTSAQLVPAQTPALTPSLALTGFDMRWMLLLGALAMLLGALAIRIASPSTTELPAGARTSR
jgi:hypothetical protein